GAQDLRTLARGPPRRGVAEPVRPGSAGQGRRGAGRGGGGASPAGPPHLRSRGAHPDGRRGRVPERLGGDRRGPLRALPATRRGAITPLGSSLLLTVETSDVIKCGFVTFGVCPFWVVGEGRALRTLTHGFQRSLL